MRDFVVELGNDIIEGKYDIDGKNTHRTTYSFMLIEILPDHLLKKNQYIGLKINNLDKSDRKPYEFSKNEYQYLYDIINNNSK